MLTLWPIAKMKQRETLVEHFVLNYNREFKDNIRDVISILTPINKFIVAFQSNAWAAV
jgi:hypothetical protein